jgi:hypothetical protein
LHIHFEERLLHVMNRLGVAGYQIVVQAHISSQLANLVIGTKRTVEQTILPQSMAALPSAIASNWIEAYKMYVSPNPPIFARRCGVTPEL